MKATAKLVPESSFEIVLTLHATEALALVRALRGYDDLRNEIGRSMDQALVSQIETMGDKP